jgi:5'-nucleotidase
VNPGGIRESLLYAATSHGEASGQVTVAECLAVQPFRERPLDTMTLTGSEIRQALEQQFAGHLRQTETQILQVSEGLGYRIDPAAPPGGRITQLVLDNDPLDPSADYRVTVNAFLADGGDGFGVFQAGRQRKGARGADYDALAAYLLRGEPVAPGPQDRVGLDDGT